MSGPVIVSGAMPAPSSIENPLAQPSNNELRAALAAARAEDDSGAFHDDARSQALWALRERRTTWFDTDELALRREIDRFFEGAWVMNSQHRLCEQYGAAVFGDLSPDGRGYVWAMWSDGAKIRFHITTPLQALHQKLSATRNRAGIDDDLRDLLTAACSPSKPFPLSPQQQQAKAREHQKQQRDAIVNGEKAKW